MVATKKAATDTVVVTPDKYDLAFQSTTLDLKRATALLARIADRRSSMPMLQTLCMRTYEDKLVLCATDLNISATVRLDIPAQVGRHGGFCVNAKALADLVKSLPPSDVSVSRHGPIGLAVSVGNVSSVMHGTSDREFPKLPDTSDLPWHEVQAEDFGAMIESVAFSVCKDETRFHLNGILYENPTGEHAIMVATDGHRLTKTSRAFAGAPTKGVIIPAKGATEIGKLLAEGKRKGTCEIAIHTPHMFVRYGAVTLAIKLIDAQFPPYEQVIPKDYKILATIERKPLIAALKRAMLTCTETHGVRFTLDGGKLVLMSDHPDTGTATETLPAETLHRAKYAIGFNPKYMLDVLGEIDCNHVTFSFGGELDPALVRSTHDAVEYGVQHAPFVGVVMPMRI